MKIKNLIASTVLTLSLTAGILVLSPTAHAAGGNVMDGNQRPIVGMWVEVLDGKSG